MLFCKLPGFIRSHGNDPAWFFKWPYVIVDSMSNSSKTLNSIAEQTKMTLDFQTQLVHWLADNEKLQRRFRYAMINKISRLESMVSLVLVGQMARNQEQLSSFKKEKLEEDGKLTEEFIENRALSIGKSIVQFMFKEEPKPKARRDRRRKWHGWEI